MAQDSYTRLNIFVFEINNSSL